jgi:hypothetical protein
MTSLLRFLILLSLVVWVGGGIFLGAVEAPTAFGVLPSRHMAGTVVGRSLTVFHWIALISGVVFLVSSLTYNQITRGNAQPFALRHLLIALMLLLTAISQFGVTPKMVALRTAFVDIDKVPADDPGRIEFNRLHVWSENLEKAILVMGVVVVYLVSRQLGSA